MPQDQANSLLLVIGNKKFSSWSLRAWIGMKHAGLSFREKRIGLYQPDTKPQILSYSPAGFVPVPQHGALTIHDTLAILEYVNEVLAPRHLLPPDPSPRARAQAVSAEMRSGFPNLRERLPMNLGRDPGPITDPRWEIDPATQAEIGRILTGWEGLLSEFGGPFLFGAWSMADCMFLPMVTRFHTYAVDVSSVPLSGDYMARMRALPAFMKWKTPAGANRRTYPRCGADLDTCAGLDRRTRAVPSAGAVFNQAGGGRKTPSTAPGKRLPPGCGGCARSRARSSFWRPPRVR